MKIIAKFVKEHPVWTIVILFLIVPACIYGLSEAPILPVCGDNDWAGFWGSYIGAIAGACVTMYVLVETLDDNKNMQKRIEVIDFCNKIVEKRAVLAQKYEETLYDAHTYMVTHEAIKESGITTEKLSKEEFDMYKKFIASHHSAKIVLYEIVNLLEIRKEVDVFCTSEFEMTLDTASKTYEMFSDFEKEVASSSSLSEIDDKRVIRVVEELLTKLTVYEKELLIKISK